ncbi:MAG: redoxin domain-containing protein [Gemmatimonadetes bacterium]|nr:redoxin domain-containing protein [Gemmatimonadota bacterium]
MTTVAMLVALVGCAGQDTGQDAPQAAPEVLLGPVDGTELPPTDLERVRVGDLAPDFSLASLSGPVMTLSDFRGERNVVLVFYRGHW